MVNLLRRFQKPLLIVVVVLVIISYVVFYNLQATNGLPTSSSVATIYGRGLTSIQLDKAAKRFDVAVRLQMSDVLFALGGREVAFAMFGQSPSTRAVEDFIWNSMVLRHEADALGVAPSQAEIEEAIRKIPPFQTNGQFDPMKYALFNQNQLSPRGFTPDDLGDIVADQIRLAKLRELIGAATHASPGEVREQYIDENQKSDISLFRLKLDDFKAAVQVIDEDVTKLYQERQSTLKTPEKRKVKYVGFTLAGESKPLAPKERAEATQRLAEQAQNLAIALTEKGAKIDEVAAKMQLKVQETPAFAQGEPPSELSRSEEAAEAAFQLTEAEPHSDAVNAENGYYVLELAGTEPSRPLTQEEAKEQLTEQIKMERGQEAMNLKVAELRTKIDTELKAGKTFEEAAQTAGVTLEKLPAFSGSARQMQGQEPPETSAIRERLASMTEGELSDLVPVENGGLVIHLDKRLPIDDADFEAKKKEVAEQIERRQDAMLFDDWLRVRRNAADVKVPQGRG